MRSGVPGRLAVIGGAFIIGSGILGAWLGARIGSLSYEPDPGGRFGHIGILSGVAALPVGAVVIWLAVRENKTLWQRVVAAILIIVFGHIGAVLGALFVGTTGLLMCYVAGAWLLVRSLADLRAARRSRSS